MLNASVGVQRVLGRLRRPPSRRASRATTVAVRSLAAVSEVQRRVRAMVVLSRLAPRSDELPPAAGVVHPVRQARISLIGRLGHDRTVALAAAAILLGASVVSVSAARPAPATGGPTGPGADVRIAVGGVSADDRGGSITEAEPANDASPTGDLEAFGKVEAIDSGQPVAEFNAQGAVESVTSQATESGAEVAPAVEPAPAVDEIGVEGPFLDDGTLLKPVAVNTTVADGRALIETYKVQSGDTLTGIASKFGISMMTIWWANDLKSKDDLRLGQVLTIPPVTGLVVTVTSADTLDRLAARYDVDTADILVENGLEDRNLVVGQVLVIPGAAGSAIPTPEPTEPPSGGSSGTSRAPATYSGGAFSWPLSGGGNYISQYYRSSHGGLDIAADYGTTVRATGSGTVIFAGWKSNGGGYQVWLAHGSGIYSTYNHMSSVSVGSGQSVSEGQQLGRVGQSGNSTGPHLHFEIWRGGVWDGGSRVNPLAYL